MRVNTSNFQFAHGKQPRGTGLWAFEFKMPRRVIRHSAQHETVVPERTLTLWHNGAYGEASRLAQTAARQLKATSVSLGS